MAFYLDPFLQLVRAPLHFRHRTVRGCFQEWRALINLKMDLYRKVGLRSWIYGSIYISSTTLLLTPFSFTL